MAQNYTRQSSFADGDTVTAALFNNEYNQLVNAFAYSSSSASSTGHRHDGTAGQGGNVPQIGDLDFLNKVVVDSTNNRVGFFVEVSSSAVEQIRVQDGAIVPVTDNDIDLGTSSLQFKDAFINGTLEADAITIAGTTLAETISDTVGAMVGSNTETGITVTYDDTDNTLDFVIGSGVIVSSMLDTNIDISGVATASTFEPDGDTAAGDNAAIGYTAAEGLILTGQGSTNDVTVKNDADTAVIQIPTGTTNVSIAGDLTVTGDLTVSGDDITMGTNTSGNLLVADGTNFNSVAVSSLSEISTVANDDVFLAIDTSGGGLKKISRSTVVSGLATSSAIANIVEDTTPQLGGDLDAQDKDIEGAGLVSAKGLAHRYGSSSSPTVFTVTVASKTAAHPYNGDGSSSAYFLNGVEAPALQLAGVDAITSSSGYYFKFDQADSSNSGHPLRFYVDAAKTVAYSTGVTTSGTPGNAGAHTTIAVTSDTPSILYYQCSSHAYMGNYVSADTTTIGTFGSVKVPVGTTAQRNSSPAAGMFRYNSTTGKFEGYTDSWGDIGGGEAQFTLDTMTGDGSDTTLTMSVTPASENSIQVYFDGVYQHKDTFSFSGTTLTFSTAPASGVAVEVIIISTVSASTTPGDGTVTTAKLAGDAVTQAKIADDAVGADQLAASAVVTASIVDDAVTSAKLANSITMTGALAAAQVNGGVTTTVVSSNATATTGQNHFISSACTLTLPASPSLGDRVMVAVGNFATAILGRNSEKIEGTAEDMTIDVARVGLTCVYTGSTYGWAIY